MVQPLQFSMIMTLDAKGVGQGAREVRQEIASTGQAAKAAGGELSAMATGMQAEAAAAKQVTQALTGVAGAEAKYRQEVQRRIGANTNRAGSPVGSTSAGGGTGGTGGPTRLPPQSQPAMLDQVRERYNPLFKIGQDYKRTLTEIAEAERTAGLSTAEAAVYRREAAAAAERQMIVLNRMPGVYGAVTGASKLTSNQLLNLSRQGNDAATMWLMGADGMQIFVSQAGQVYGALQEGPGGVAGSIKAVGTSLLALATPTNLAIVGFTAAAAAGIYFATRTEKQIKPLNEAMDAHKEALKGVAEAYGLALDKADKYAKSVSPGVATLQERQSRAELQLSAQDTLAKSFKPSAFSSDYLRYSPSLGEIGLLETDVAPKYEAFRKPLMALNAELEKGKGDAIAFVEAVATIANQDLANDKLRELAAKLIEVAAPAAAAQRQLQAMALSVDAVTQATQKAYRERRDTLESFVPDTRSERQKITEAYQGQMNAAPRLAGSARAAEGIQINATRQYKRAIDEVERSEENARRSRELDIASISARTAAQKASIAQQRIAIELNTAEGDKIEATERQRRIAAEGLKVYAEAQREANDALRGAMDDLALVGLEGHARELAAINQEVAREIELNPQAAASWRAYGEARRAALEVETSQSLFRPQEEELAKLNAEAAAIGTSAAERRRIMTDLQAEQDLRRAGIELGSREADIYRQQARALAEYRADIERTGKAWDAFGETGSNALDKVLDAAFDLDGKMKPGELFADIAKDFSKTIIDLSIKNPLKNAVSGGEAPTMGDIGGFEGLWKRITGQAIATPAAPSITLGERGSTTSNPLFVSLVGASGIPRLDLLGGTNGTAPIGAVTRGGALAPAAPLDADSKRVADAWSVTAGTGMAPTANGAVPVSQMAEYIRQAAAARGIDPAIALRVARSEGLGEGIWQSNYKKNGFREPSYGPFQLLKGGPGTGFGRGLGNAFMDQTGLDPADPRNAYAGVDFALNNAAKSGWGAWYGAAKVGVGRWEGLGGARAMAGGGLQSADYQQQIQQSASALSESAEALVPAANQFQTGFDGALNGQLLGGIGQAVDQFLPGWGGVLQKLLSSMGSGGGGLGGLSNLFGGGGASDPWAGLRFDTGGYTGPGARHAIAGYVHRGEVVWNQDDVKAVGGPEKAEAIRLGVRSGGPGHEHGGIVGGRTMAMPNASAGRGAGRDGRSDASGQPTVIFDPKFVNAPPVKEVRREPDGRGGRRMVVEFERRLAGSMSQPGSPFDDALTMRGSQIPTRQL
ncbi:phage tail length tape measure family protein [Aurantimonas sp. 22II-16-19i]|uniref:phage tail length tape measure family protein n=1 Tax=Aurantimonas sp. 22II-16-19i TaxID=1317114 RepID=UPI0009F7D39F|nr:phage tail length tape measure family protein [Aurantimonas sp. 22II-16-19i]ORE85743.1 prophage tail length tape measure [Aurantimonas sp. 22II-16-19i]